MIVRLAIRIILLVSIAGLLNAVSAQEPPAPPRKSARPARISPPTPETRAPAPQVVTIVHRLNGLKMFRLLLRSEEQIEAIARLDDGFNLMDDVHTSIIAGLAMDDGRTIAAWLPDAEVEFGPAIFAPRAPLARSQAPPDPISSLRALNIERPGFPLRGGMLGSPDLTVIGADGRRLPAEYVGLDAATGLSILRLSDLNISFNPSAGDKAVGEGESIRLLNPEPAESSRQVVAGSLYVRMGTTNGTIVSVKRVPSGGGVARLSIKSPRLTAANIGGVAVNESGETIGIVDRVEGAEATILPTGLIRRAAKRVLAQHTSVPRPWLGVKGEPLARLSIEQIKNQGWKVERATSLLKGQRGILLTSIAPGSPASVASLRAGDVILKVNDEDVENGDDFSWLLDQAGPSTQVTFTLARPNRATEEAVTVELSGLADPRIAFGIPKGPITASPLIAQGIETVALRPMVAAQLGTSSGLLIVYVDPSSGAFSAGLRPGDVIESIDGKPVSYETFPSAASTSAAALNFQIVRQKQKLVVTLSSPEKQH